MLDTLKRELQRPSHLYRGAIANRAVSRRRTRRNAPTTWRRRGRTRWLPGEGCTSEITVACGAMTSEPQPVTTEDFRRDEPCLNEVAARPVT
jgi:hypothetical protein